MAITSTVLTKCRHLHLQRSSDSRAESSHPEEMALRRDHIYCVNSNSAGQQAILMLG